MSEGSGLFPHLSLQATHSALGGLSHCTASGAAHEHPEKQSNGYLWMRQGREEQPSFVGAPWARHSLALHCLLSHGTHSNPVGQLHYPHFSDK